MVHWSFLKCVSFSFILGCKLSSIVLLDPLTSGVQQLKEFMNVVKKFRGRLILAISFHVLFVKF